MNPFSKSKNPTPGQSSSSSPFAQADKKRTFEKADKLGPFGQSGNSGKLAGRPKIPQIPGCSIHDNWSGNRHVFTMFGKPQERCVKCGIEHPDITTWRRGITSGDIENHGHPYVVAGYWSLNEYKLAMRRNG